MIDENLRSIPNNETPSTSLALAPGVVSLISSTSREAFPNDDDMRRRFLVPLPRIVIYTVFLFVFCITGGGTASASAPPECTVEGRCDTHERCKAWRDEGECRRSADYMVRYCPASCGASSSYGDGDFTAFGGGNDEEDTTEDAAASSDPDNAENEFDAEEDEVDSEDEEDPENESWRDILAATTEFGVRQVAVGDRAADTIARIEASIFYMQSDVVTSLDYAAREKCQNLHRHCAFWAVIGECDDNGTYMHASCGPSCRSCHLHNKVAAVKKESLEHAGDMDEL